MVELFNPAGLRMLEDRQGAIAYGYVAPRVLYARFVGCLSAELGLAFVDELESVAGEVVSLAYFADTSALREYHPRASSRFKAFIIAQRQRFASIVMLTSAVRGGPAWQALSEAAGDAAELVYEPLDFERALCNVATFPHRAIKDWAHVWQLHSPR
jgi:hypothetical protein